MCCLELLCAAVFRVACMLWFALRRCALLCFALLCLVLLCYALLYFAMLCYAMLCSALLCYAMLALLCARSGDFFFFSHDFVPTLWEPGGGVAWGNRGSPLSAPCTYSTKSENHSKQSLVREKRLTYSQLVSNCPGLFKLSWR